MSVATSISSKHQLSLPSDFTIQDRTVFHKQNEALYVPLIYLPVKITATVSKDYFLIELGYRLEEGKSETFIKSKNVVISQGRNTKRIFSIRAEMVNANFTILRNRMQDARAAVSATKDKTKSEIQKKNYALILSLIDKIIANVSHDRTQIETEIFSANF